MNPSFSFLFIKKYQGCERFYWLMIMYKYVNECIWMLIAVLKIIPNVLIVWKSKNKTFLVCNLIAHIVIFKSSWIDLWKMFLLVNRMFLKFMSSFYEKMNLFFQIFWKKNKNMKPSSCMKMGQVSFFKLFRSLIFIGEMSELSSSLSPLLNSCHSICEFEQIKGHHQCNAKHFYFFSPVFFYNLYPPQYIY